MKQDERREEIILGIEKMLRHLPFTFEYKVKKKPAGIKVICEVTQEQMEKMLRDNLGCEED